jgi:hypothetical protein
LKKKTLIKDREFVEMDSNINTLNNQLLQIKMKNRAAVFNNTQVMENLLKCFCHRKSTTFDKDSASRKNSQNMTDQDIYTKSGLGEATKRNINSSSNNNNNNNNRRFDDLAEEEEEEMINLTITQTNKKDGKK